MKNSMAALALAGLAALVGCNGSEKQDDPEKGKAQGQVPIEERGGNPPEEPRVEENLTLQWDEIDRDDRGIPDAEQVATWVAERRRLVDRCLNNEPQAVTQARETLEEIVKRVPDSSKDRYLLAKCLFSETAYWWRVTDVTAWEMGRLQLDKTPHDSEELPPGTKLTDAQIEERLAKLRPVLDRNLRALNEVGGRAMRSFILYRQQRPDDKSIYDYVWKLNFFLQDYEEARKWLQLVIYEMDQAGIPAADPDRKGYEDLEKEITDKIGDAKMGKGFQPVRPMSRDRFGSRRVGDR